MQESVKIYKIGRNDLCICGSEEKYKKCCMSQVEEATKQISEAVKDLDYTTAKNDIVETLGFVCGLRTRVEGDEIPDAGLLGKLLADVWRTEIAVIKKGDLLKDVFQRFSKDFQDVLGTKQFLRGLRIPVQILQEVDPDYSSESKDVWAEKVLSKITGMVPDLLPRTVEAMAFSLHHEEYNEDELKALLLGLSWAVGDDTQEFFFLTLLEKTEQELYLAQKEMQRILQEEDENKQMPQLHQLMMRYPIYDDLLSTNILAKINPAYEAITKKELELEMPFYSFIEGFYASMCWVGEGVAQLMAKKQQKEQTCGQTDCSQCECRLNDMEKDVALTTNELHQRLIEEIFWRQESSHFIPAVVTALEKAKEGASEELAESIKYLISSLGMMITTAQMRVAEYLYLFFVSIFLNNMPGRFPDTGWPVEKVASLLDEKLINHYCEYLEEMEMNDEVEYVREIYAKWIDQANKGFVKTNKFLATLSN